MPIGLLKELYLQYLNKLFKKILLQLDKLPVRFRMSKMALQQDIFIRVVPDDNKFQIRAHRPWGSVPDRFPPLPDSVT